MAGKKRIQKGRVIRVSADTESELRTRRKAGESWDALFRRLLGIPTRKGTEQPRKTFWLLERANLIFRTEKEARGMALVLAVRSGKQRVHEPPIKVVAE